MIPALYSILEKGIDDDHECVEYFRLRLLDVIIVF